jgi:hypothetical protein
MQPHGFARNPSSVIPTKVGIQCVYVIARETRDSMQTLDARFRGHDGIF